MVNVGVLVKQMRESRCMSQEELADGIVARESLSRLENNQRGMSNDKLDKLFARMGYEAKQFFMHAQSYDEMEIYRLRDEIDNYIRREDEAAARKAMFELEERLADNPCKFHRQYVLFTRTVLLWGEGCPPAELRALLDDAIHITIPDFDEAAVYGYLLGGTELEIVNMMHVVHRENGRDDLAIALLTRLSKNIRKNYMNDTEKAGRLTFILINLSSVLGMNERYDEALALVEEGIELGQRYCALKMLPCLAYNKAYILHHTKQEEQVPDLLRQAYYGNKALGFHVAATRIKEKALRNFGVEL